MSRYKFSVFCVLSMLVFLWAGAYLLSVCPPWMLVPLLLTAAAGFFVAVFGLITLGIKG